MKKYFTKKNSIKVFAYLLTMIFYMFVGSLTIGMFFALLGVDDGSFITLPGYILFWFVISHKGYIKNTRNWFEKKLGV